MTFKKNMANTQPYFKNNKTENITFPLLQLDKAQNSPQKLLKNSTGKLTVEDQKKYISSILGKLYKAETQ